MKTTQLSLLLFVICILVSSILCHTKGNAVNKKGQKENHAVQDKNNQEKKKQNQEQTTQSSVTSKNLNKNAQRTNNVDQEHEKAKKHAKKKEETIKHAENKLSNSKIKHEKGLKPNEKIKDKNIGANDIPVGAQIKEAKLKDEKTQQKPDRSVEEKRQQNKDSEKPERLRDTKAKKHEDGETRQDANSTKASVQQTTADNEKDKQEAGSLDSTKDKKIGETNLETEAQNTKPDQGSTEKANVSHQNIPHVPKNESASKAPGHDSGDTSTSDQEMTSDDVKQNQNETAKQNEIQDAKLTEQKIAKQQPINQRNNLEGFTAISICQQTTCSSDRWDHLRIVIRTLDKLSTNSSVSAESQNSYSPDPHISGNSMTNHTMHKDNENLSNVDTMRRESLHTACGVSVPETEVLPECSILMYICDVLLYGARHLPNNNVKTENDLLHGDPNIQEEKQHDSKSEDMEVPQKEEIAVSKEDENVENAISGDKSDYLDDEKESDESQKEEGKNADNKDDVKEREIKVEDGGDDENGVNIEVNEEGKNASEREDDKNGVKENTENNTDRKNQDEKENQAKNEQDNGNVEHREHHEISRGEKKSEVEQAQSTSEDDDLETGEKEEAAKTINQSVEINEENKSDSEGLIESNEDEVTEEIDGNGDRQEMNAENDDGLTEDEVPPDDSENLQENQSDETPDSEEQEHFSNDAEDPDDDSEMDDPEPVSKHSMGNSGESDSTLDRLKDMNAQILRLENQLLGKALEGENMKIENAKLENQMLRLENTVLLLNQSYHKLQVDSEDVKSKLNSQNVPQVENMSKEIALKENRLSVDVQLQISNLNKIIRKQTWVLERLKRKWRKIENQDIRFQTTQFQQMQMLHNLMQRIGAIEQSQSVSRNSGETSRPIRHSNTSPFDCYDLYMAGENKDGVYKFQVFGTQQVFAYCDMENKGWTVIQRRSKGDEDFFRKWSDYRHGFGDPDGDYWLGNDAICHLTNKRPYKLLVEMEDWENNQAYAEYSHFQLETEDQGYRLRVMGYKGTAGDALSKHNNQKFSTKDVDNDQVETNFGGSCAQRFNGAWWYYKCYKANLNGVYYVGGIVPENRHDGIVWKPWKGINYSLKTVTMKIKPYV